MQQNNLKPNLMGKMMSIQHKPIEWRCHPFTDLSVTDLYAILQLRQEVFVVEQECPYLDADGQDADAHHLMGFINNHLALYTRLFYLSDKREGIIGRVIVKEAYRGLGLGYELMEESERWCLQMHSPTKITLGAQAHLQSFYNRLGYLVYGDEYDEDGIPHLPMRKFYSMKIFTIE